VDQWTPLLAKLGGKPVEAAEREAAETAASMETLAKELVPVDTGRLQSTIKGVAQGLEVTLSADTEYASYVEYGTRKMRAQPYLRPAMDAYAPSILSRIKTTFLQLLGV
jgi:HK97 gp10 family phage protein